MKRPTIQSPNIQFRGDGSSTPYAEDFADKYFSETDGLAESCAVFVEASGLPQRWRGERRFVVGELGFGTGLNFLATWQAWAQDAQRCDTLHFVSVERSPLPKADVAQALSAWPSLTTHTQALLAQYPHPSPGHHLLSFDEGRVRLLLAFGDVEVMLPEWHLGVDAWYLDGFAPSRNQAMWSPTVFKHMARNTRIGGTVATFTAAGQVRRDLQSSGFDMQKKTGFGGKRERLVGVFQPPSIKQASDVSEVDVASKRFIIVGDGVAGLWMAYALKSEAPEADITIIAPEHEAEQWKPASQNPAAIVMPQLSGAWTAKGLLHWQAFGHAQRAYRRLAEQCGASDWLWQGEALRQLTPALDERQDDVLQASCDAYQLPPKAVQATPHGLRFRHALVVCGDRFRQAMWAWLTDAQQANPVTRIKGRVTKASASQLALNTPSGAHCIALDEHTHVIHCLGAGSAHLFADEQSPMPWHTTFGQLLRAKATAQSTAFNTALSKDWYLTPNLGGWGHALGSSFERGLPFEADTWQTMPANPEALEALKQRFQDSLPAFGHEARQALAELQPDAQAFASWRLHSTDRLPMLGRLPNTSALTSLDAQAIDKLRNNRRGFLKHSEPYTHTNQHLFTALGSHGFNLAPLLASSLAAELLGSPQPLQRTLRRKLSPMWRVVL